jgi:LEA14-like dessication related protein
MMRRARMHYTGDIPDSEKNMKLKSALIIVVAAAVLVLGSCESLDGLLNNAMPRATVERVEFTGIDFSQIDLLFTVRIDNPNPFGVSLAGLDYALSVEGSAILSGDLDRGLQIAAGASSTVQIPVSVSYRNIFDVVEGSGDQGQLAYRMDFALKFDLPGIGSQRLPLRHEGDLPALRIPSISFRQLRLNSISLRSIDLELVLGIDNPNPAALNIKAFRYDLDINGRSWLSAAVIPSRNLGGGSDQEIRVPVSLSILEVGQSVVQLLRSSTPSLEFRMEVDALLGADIPAFRDFPWRLSLSGDVPLVK